MKNRKIINWTLTLLLTTMYIVVFRHFFIQKSLHQFNQVFIALWGFYGILVVFSIISYNVLWLKKSDNKPLKDANIIAIIPSFNEDPDLLDQTIHSLLKQSVYIKEIHVVDDGSDNAIRKIDDDRIIYYKQVNKGKRYAQKLVIDTLDRNNMDFILTVDSDSVVERTAAEKLLRAFQKDEKVMACTGTVLTKNYSENILTRLTDLNIGISCIIARPIRSVFGALETTSGALALYRKDIFFDNIEDYVTSGTYSDDRRLCLYSTLSGKSTAVTEAVVFSAMPETFTGMCKQRLRWGKGSWKAFPFQVANLPYSKLIFPFIGMLQLLITPIFLATMIYSVYRGYYSYVITFLGIRLFIRYIESALYLAARPRMSAIEKILTWIFITPLEFIYTLTVLIVIKFTALFHLNKDGWLTRGTKKNKKVKVIGIKEIEPIKPAKQAKHA